MPAKPRYAKLRYAKLCYAKLRYATLSDAAPSDASSATLRTPYPHQALPANPNGTALPNHNGTAPPTGRPPHHDMT